MGFCASWADGILFPTCTKPCSLSVIAGTTLNSSELRQKTAVLNKFKHDKEQLLSMISRANVSTIYQCSLERAFKTPLLCDVSKVHTGYGIMPPIIRSTDDQDWGQVGSTKKVYAAKSLTQKGGFASLDKVLERVENKYWKFEVSDFQSWMLGFYKFTGEWKTTELEPNKILVEYSYLLHSNLLLLYPLNWLFAQLFWKRYMSRVLENVRILAYNNEPYLYS